MKRRCEPSPADWLAARDSIIGLGERSSRKSYYPQLQQRVAELERFRTLLDYTPDMILLVQTADTLVLDANAAARRRLAGGSGLAGKALDDALSPEAARRLLAPEAAGSWIELILDHGHGPATPVEASFRTVTLNDGTFGILVMRDISVRKEYEAELVRQANFDPLTGLPNRALFQDRLDQALSQARRRGWKLAVMILDLDRFKQVNDTMGHGAGDEVLRQAGARLPECVRTVDTVARLGGDEFTVILPEIVGFHDAEAVGQRILSRMAQPFQACGRDVFMSASIGISLYPNDGENAEALMGNADTAMYRAKAEGRDAYRFFTPDMNRQVRERTHLENMLRRALARDELSLAYQPVVDITSGRIVGAEALMRWTCPEIGPIPPDAFIPVAEDTGMILTLGEWALRTACAQLGRWRPPPGFRLAVNVSTRQFRDPALPAMLEEMHARLGTFGARLDVEITESLLIGNDLDVAPVLEHLRTLGVGLSIDDFGTGYSSLGYLKRFPIDTLKIDRMFVRDVARASGDAALATAIVAMAHGLGMRVIAEGIEEIEQVMFLRRLGCQEGQGYLFSRPVTGGAFRDLLHTSNGRLTAPLTVLDGPEL